MPVGTSLHTWPETACGGMSIGERGAMGAARSLAGVGLELMTDPALHAAVRDSLTKRLDGRTYVNAIPAERKRPMGLPAEMVKTGDEMLAAQPG